MDFTDISFTQEELKFIIETIKNQNYSGEVVEVIAGIKLKIKSAIKPSP